MLPDYASLEYRTPAIGAMNALYLLGEINKTYSVMVQDIDRITLYHMRYLNSLFKALRHVEACSAFIHQEIKDNALNNRDKHDLSLKNIEEFLTSIGVS